jgi:hypothetical protein
MNPPQILLRSTMEDRRFSRSLFPLLAVFWVEVLTSDSSIGAGADWIRPGVSTNKPVWGLSGGLHWAIAPAGFRGGEPRGLIRLGYPVLADNGYDLINFIAIEPIVEQHRGLPFKKFAFDSASSGKHVIDTGVIVY